MTLHFFIDGKQKFIHLKYNLMYQENMKKIHHLIKFLSLFKGLNNKMIETKKRLII